MKDQLNRSKGFLKDKLGNYQVDPPEQVWDVISSRLGGRKRRGWIIIGLSAAATVALAVTLGINYFSSDVPEGKGMAEVETGTDVETSTVESLNSGRKLDERVVETLQEIAREETVSDESGIESVVAEAVVKENTGDPEPFEVVNEANEEDIQEVVPEVNPDVDEDRSTSLSGQAPGEEVTAMEASGTEPEPEPEPDIDLDPSLDPGIEFEDEQVRDKRWILGASLSPLYSFRDAEASALNGSAHHESGLVSYAGGIQVGYRAGKRLAIESGIFFNKMGVSIGSPGIQQFEQSFDFAPMGENANRSNVKAISNSVGNIVSNSGDIYVNNYMLNASSVENTLDDLNSIEYNDGGGIRQHLDYLEVPFNIRYTLIDRSVEMQLVGGMSTNLLINNYVSMNTSAGTENIGYLTNIRSVNYSGNVGFGMVYHFREHLSLMMEPRFRYFLNSINDSSLPSTRPYTFGLYTGLSYIF